MEDKQLQTMAGLITGLQYAVAAAIDHLVQGDPARREAIAKHLRDTAMHVPPDVANREIVAMVIKQFASAFTNMRTQEDPGPLPEELRKFLR